MTRALFRLSLLPALALLAGCAGHAAPQSVTERDTLAACRDQAQTAYTIRHRAEIYIIHERDTPYSGIGLLRSPTQDLSDRYEQEHQIETCVRNTGTGPGGTARP